MGLTKGASIPVGRERGANPVRDLKLTAESVKMLEETSEQLTHLEERFKQLRRRL